MDLAGEELVPNANAVSTQKIRIDAPIQLVWPWLVQMGQGRGGFYSYAWLENLIGCQMKNADRIHPEWQNLEPGDGVSIHPRAAQLIVAQLAAESHLVLHQERPLQWSWSFNLFEDQGSCCLVVRTRIHWQRLWTRWLLGPLMRVGHFIMERKMLRGIKSRAEGLLKCQNQ